MSIPLEVENLVPNVCELGEAPHWSDEEQCLYYVDIMEKKVHRFDPEKNENKFIQLEGEENVSLIVPIEAAPNEFVITRDRSFRRLFWNSKTGGEHREQVMLNIDEDKPGNRLNDGKCDAKGRLWAGTLGPSTGIGAAVHPKQGSVFKIGPAKEDGSHPAEKAFENVDVANGLCWSNDNKVMYYIDTMTFGVDAFDFDDVTGTVSNRRVIFSFEKNQVQGYPDGMTIDDKEHLWVACFMGSKVIEIDPRTSEEHSGILVSQIQFPAKNITSVAFGGKDCSDLYVTSAKWGDDSGLTGSGSLFRVKGAASGFPGNFFVAN